VALWGLCCTFPHPWASPFIESINTINHHHKLLQAIQKAALEAVGVSLVVALAVQLVAVL